MPTGGAPDRAPGSLSSASAAGHAGSAKGGASGGAGKKVDQVTASLTAIYGETPAQAKDLLHTMERARRRTWLALGVGLALLVALATVAAWVGFWWWGSRDFSGEGLQLTVEGPSRVSLGQETTYFINWFNRSKNPFAALEVRVSFPNDFVIASVEPKPTGQPLVFRLGAQAVEARGVLKVTGTFTGALGTRSAVQVIGTYRPVSSNSGFEELVTRELEYTDTVLAGRLTAPPKVLPGDKVTVAYTLTNQGSAAITGLLARVSLPDGFVGATLASPLQASPLQASPLRATSTSDLLDERAVTLPIGALEPGASSTVRVTGSFALGSHGEAVFQAQAGRLTSDGIFAAAQKSEASVSVLAGDLNVKLVINGSDQSRSLPLGEQQRVAISYQNTSGEELRDVTLRFHLGDDAQSASSSPSAPPTSLVEWGGLDDSVSGTRSGDTLTYGADQIGQFARLPPDADGLIELTVPVINHVTTSRDAPILAWVEATIGAVDRVKVNRTVKTQPIVFRFQTDAALSSIARYASEEGAPLGRGPLPPIVGTTTTYRIEWRIAKTLHGLERVSVSAALPKNVSFGGVKEVGAGDVGYDPERRLVSWTINKIPPNVDELVATFDAGLAPFASDAGRFAPLLGEARLDFTDSVLGEPLARTAPPFTTDLPDDDLAKGKGVVKKP